MEVGEKYLSIKLEVGRLLAECHKAITRDSDYVDVAAFLNKEREGTQPHFKGRSVAVWINKKKPEQKKEVLEEQIVEDLL